MTNFIRLLKSLSGLLVLGLAGWLLVRVPPPEPSRVARDRIREDLARLPLSFEANQGQSDPAVKFLARGPGYSLFLTSTEAVLSPGGAHRAAIRMKLVGGNPAPRVAGVNPLSGRSHYLLGNDRAKWRVNIPNYAGVQYREVYPGVDLTYHGNPRELEYDFTVAPGADPGVIQVTFEGVERAEVDRSGDLLLHTPDGEVRQHRPLVYQEEGGVRRAVSGGYVLRGERGIGFAVGRYDAGRALVIDPVLSYSTYLGGGGDDRGFGIGVDSAGAMYIAGDTTGTGFPTANPLRPSGSGPSDIFVTKLNAAGTSLVYSTYLGGAGDDAAYGLALDAAGNVYVTGETDSADFPTAGAAQTAKGASFDAFLVKLNAAGSALLYSTYLGADGDDTAIALAVDGSGNAYVTGLTDSTAFPTTKSAAQTAYGGGFADMFLTKLNTAATGAASLVYSTYLGGTGDDEGQGVGVDPAGNVYVAGLTDSPNFPTTASALQKIYGGGLYDAFLTKWNLGVSGAASLVYSSYLGGSGDDEAFTLAVDAAGNAYLTGSTVSTNFPVTPGAFQSAYGGGTSDAFLTKWNPAASGAASLVYSTYLGGSGYDDGDAVAFDSSGNVYIAGETNSTNFPIAGSAFQTVSGGGFDAHIAKFNPAASGAASLLYSTYLGGSGNERALGITVDASGKVYVTGRTSSTNFTTAGALQGSFGGGASDAFIARLVEAAAPPPPNPVSSVSAASFTPGASLAAESIVSGFGTRLATDTASATATPLPTSLLGTTLKVTDSAGTARLAPLFFVAPGQANYLMPAGTKTGPATVTVTAGDSTVSTGTVTIDVVAPALFSANANGSGVAAALALRVRADGSQSSLPVFQFDATQKKSVAAPIDPGPDTDQIILLLFGTGVRGHSSGLSGVSATIGSVAGEVLYAGPQGDFVGLDQINVRLSRSLSGRGDADIVLKVDSKQANVVTVNIGGPKPASVAPAVSNLLSDASRGNPGGGSGQRPLRVRRR